jgi:hypothetical protein
VRLSDRLIALSSGHVSYDGSPEDADVVMLSEGVHPGDD